MAVFLINSCKFDGCGITFPSLGDLIQHIEDTHIDYDPQVIEQKEKSQPTCLPLSYVLRFITDAARKEGPFLGTSGAELKRKLAIKHHSYSISSSNRSGTPTGSEMDEDEIVVSELEDSNDSWTTEEFSSEFIMKYGSRHSLNSNGTNSINDKPFACPVPGCKKRYKNVNGIKYHSKNGHKKDGKIRKGYKCHCGKSYKTSQGLKTHSIVSHNNNLSPDVSSSSLSANNSPTGSVITTSSSSSSSSAGSDISLLSINSGNIINNNNFNGNLNNNSNNQLSPNSSTIKNNFGLITIKTKPTSSSSSTSTGNKLVKICSDNNSNNDKLETSPVKMSLPSLVNLGILTPATSPKLQQLQQLHHHQQQQQQHQQQQQQQLNNHQQQQILPLTPISPKNISFSGTVVNTLTEDT